MMTRTTTLAFAAIILVASAIDFDLVDTEEKCLGEEMGTDILATGNFLGRAVDSENAPRPINFEIRDPEKNLLHANAKAAEGSFKFRTEADGEHHFCFRNAAGSNDGVTRVTLNLDVGANAQFKEIATAQVFEPVEAALLYLEIQLKNLYKKVEDIREHEQKMELTSQSTQRRLVAFSCVTMFVLVAFGCWEIYYLKQYFRAKKLI